MHQNAKSYTPCYALVHVCSCQANEPKHGNGTAKAPEEGHDGHGFLCGSCICMDTTWNWTLVGDKFSYVSWWTYAGARGFLLGKSCLTVTLADLGIRLMSDIGLLSDEEHYMPRALCCCCAAGCKRPDSLSLLSELIPFWSFLIFLSVAWPTFQQVPIELDVKCWTVQAGIVWPVYGGNAEAPVGAARVSLCKTSCCSDYCMIVWRSEMVRANQSLEVIRCNAGTQNVTESMRTIPKAFLSNHSRVHSGTVTAYKCGVLEFQRREGTSVSNDKQAATGHCLVSEFAADARFFHSVLVLWILGFSGKCITIYHNEIQWSEFGNCICCIF